MKTFVLFSMPGYGHTYPLLKVVSELVNKGNRVIFYSIGEFQSKIEATGAIYRNYPPILYEDPILSADTASAARFIIEATKRMMPIFLSEVKKDKPDCIIYDTLALWGKLLSVYLQLPSVSLFTLMAFNPAIEKKYFSLYMKTVIQAIFAEKSFISTWYQYKKLAKHYKGKPSSLGEFLSNKGDVNIVFTSSYLHPCIESFNNSFNFVGPIIYERDRNTDMIKKLSTNKKIIYISAGTIVNDNLRYYQTCINAFGNSMYQVVIALGHRFALSDLSAIPENIVVMNYVPQLAILEKTDVFITHGGFNSINESLYYGVPMVLVPQTVEQTVNALRVQELGAGVYLSSKKATEETLMSTVQKVFIDKSYSMRAEKIKHSLREAGGYKSAVARILTLVEG